MVATKTWSHWNRSVKTSISFLCLCWLSRSVLAVNPYPNLFVNRRRGASTSALKNSIHSVFSASSSSYRFIPDRKDGRNGSEKYDEVDSEEDDYDDYYSDEDETRLGWEIKRQLEQAMERSYGVRPWSIEMNTKRANEYSWTTRLVTMNVIGYLLQCVAPGITQMGIKRSELILQGRQLHRLVTPIALHGNFIHLLMNTYSLQNIGPEVERMFGPGRFLATYLISGITGNILSSIYTPNPSLGASGAIFGLVGAYYAFLQQNGSLFGRSGRMQMDSVTRTMVLNIGFGFASPNVDNWGHIGGAIGGVLMAETFGPKLLVMGLPGGNRMIVDKPTVRIPHYIERIPDQISHKFSRVSRRMRMDRYQSTLSAKPWRRSKFRKRRNIQKNRKKPIKPRYYETQ